MSRTYHSRTHRLKVPTPACDALAESLRVAVKRYEQPNTFSLTLLYMYCGAPPPALAGRIGMRFMDSLFSALGGREHWGSPPVYDPKRREFIV